MRRFLTSRKVLAASIGVATVTYVACSSTGVDTTTPPKPDDAGVVDEERFVGNLMPGDSSPVDVSDVGPVGDEFIVGNLVAPPFDGANDATLDSSDANDATGD